MLDDIDGEDATDCDRRRLRLLFFFFIGSAVRDEDRFGVEEDRWNGRSLDLRDI